MSAASTTSSSVAAMPTMSSALERKTGAASGRAIRSAGGEAAVHHQLRAGHERGLVTREEERDVGDLPRPRDAPERNSRLELLADRVGEVGRLKRRVHDARVDHVARSEE